jgi:hypothetical protein
MMPIPRERDIRAYLYRRATECGGEARKVKWIGRRGAPDELLLMPGWSCFVELKTPSIVAEDYQVREHDRLRAAGVEVLVIDSYSMVDTLLARKLP